ncbi:hypothetical protein PAXINDRAFT_177881 [Paxillus involutus ATCC 200175]|nr:hypothetical protein PAXINDRAFT_177881 [Paxillus involutus ATCC 200175]
MGLLNVDPHNSPRHWRDFRGENLESESSVPYGTTSLVPRMHYSIFCSPDGVALFLSLGSDTASDKPDDPFANAPIDGFLQSAGKGLIEITGFGCQVNYMRISEQRCIAPTGAEGVHFVGDWISCIRLICHRGYGGGRCAWNEVSEMRSSFDEEHAVVDDKSRVRGRFDGDRFRKCVATYNQSLVLLFCRVESVITGVSQIHTSLALLKLWHPRSDNGPTCHSVVQRVVVMYISSQTGRLVKGPEIYPNSRIAEPTCRIHYGMSCWHTKISGAIFCFLTIGWLPDYWDRVAL